MELLWIYMGVTESKIWIIVYNFCIYKCKTALSRFTFLHDNMLNYSGIRRTVRKQVYLTTKALIIPLSTDL